MILPSPASTVTGGDGPGLRNRSAVKLSSKSGPVESEHELKRNTNAAARILAPAELAQAHECIAPLQVSEPIVTEFSQDNR